MTKRWSPGNCSTCECPPPRKIIRCTDTAKIIVPEGLVAGVSQWHLSMPDLYNSRAAADRTPVGWPASDVKVCDCDVMNGDYSFPVRVVNSLGLPSTGLSDPGLFEFGACDFVVRDSSDLWEEQLLLAAVATCSALTVTIRRRIWFIAGPPPTGQSLESQYVKLVSGTLDLTSPLVLHPPNYIIESDAPPGATGLSPIDRDRSCFTWDAGWTYPSESDDADLASRPSISIWLTAS